MSRVLRSPNRTPLFAQQSTDIGAAFGEIASEILRIAR